MLSEPAEGGLAPVSRASLGPLRERSLIRRTAITTTTDGAEHDHDQQASQHDQ